MKNIIFIIVDDEEITATLYQALCKHIFPGAEFILTDDGEHVLNCVDKTFSDDKLCIAIIDNQMPKMSGTELVQRLRSKGKKFPIIMVSGINIEGEALENGADVFLQKPFKLNKLKMVLENFL